MGSSDRVLPRAKSSRLRPGGTLEPINRTSVSATIFEQIVSFIVTEHWNEGYRLPPERDLSRDLGVARASLREALKALELIGMLESRIGDGTFVCKRSNFLSRPLLWAMTGSHAADVDEIVEARTALEIELAALAAKRATQADLQEMQDAIELLKQEGASGGLEAAWQADMQFHIVVARSAHNQILSNALSMLRNLMKQWMLSTLQIPWILELAVQQHTAIFNAISARDTAAARDQMRNHIERMGELLGQIQAAIQTIPQAIEQVPPRSSSRQQSM